MRTRPPTSVSIAPETWNFDRVPMGELETCYFYEFAREYLRNSKRLRGMILEVNRRQKAPSDSLERKGIWKLLTDFRELVGDSQNPLAPCMCSRDLLETPWQSIGSLPEPWKDWLLEIVAKWIPPSPAHPLALPLKIQLARDFPKQEKSGSEDWAWWAFLQHQFHEHSVNHEVGWLCIDWDYRDEALKAAFAEVLKQRPPGTGTRDERGKIKRKKDLKALAAKRLLDSGLTASKAGEQTGLFNVDRSWYSAKRKANEKLREMFPNKI